MIGTTWERVVKEVDLATSAMVSLRDLRSVGVFIGPYRNLTTLTASVLSLHPCCQVLNHAGQRVLGDERMDFIQHDDAAHLARFARFAIRISGTGRRGQYGGAIWRSHAYDPQYPLMAFYHRRFGRRTRKPRIISLVWKESLLLSRHIRKHRATLPKVSDSGIEIRVIAPIRDPIDCALSNLATGHVRWFEHFDGADPLRSALTCVLDEFAWAYQLRAEDAKRVVVFHEEDVSAALAATLAASLQLPSDSAWLNDAACAFRVVGRPSRPSRPDVVDLCRDLISERCHTQPTLAERLLANLERRQTASGGNG